MVETSARCKGHKLTLFNSESKLKNCVVFEVFPCVVFDDLTPFVWVRQRFNPVPNAHNKFVGFSVFEESAMLDITAKNRCV
jgi:hypothetical protein